MSTPALPVLSVLRIDPAHSEARLDAQDTHRMHVRVLTALPPQPGPGPGRVLWAQPLPDLLHIQAASAADAARLPRGYLRGAGAAAVPLDWLPGQPVTLSLIASPAKRAPSPRVHGVRVGPRKRIGLPGDQREGWLRRKLAGAVDITSVAGCHLGTRTGRRPGGIVIHPWHAFTVRATVRDPRMLAALVLAGVGPAKGYGCGLLTVQQAR